MASVAAALLDELMGRNRNANPDDKAGNIKWADDEVCKRFLCGYCPSELFTNTKADLGPCNLIHDESLRKEYQASDKFEKMGYEEAWIEGLEEIVNDVDKKIKRGHQRLAMTQEGDTPANPVSGPRNDQIVTLTTKINDLVENAEKLGNEGKVEEAQGVMKLCEQLRKERHHQENLSNDRQNHIAQQAKQMEVCPVCGAFLIVGDAESRQREHLMGKQHMGYAQMRATVEEFKERKRQKIAAHKAEMEKRREDERKRREEREKARRRSRSRDRRGNRRSSRERRRSLSRDRRRSRSRDRMRRRSRSRDRRRSRSPARRRSRSRDKRRSRERRRSRDRRSPVRSRRSRSRDGDRRSSKKSSRASSRDRRDRSRDGRRERSREKSVERASREKLETTKSEQRDDGSQDTNGDAIMAQNGEVNDHSLSSPKRTTTNIQDDGDN
ncbi:luc7-like protein 3 [Watersipora subatra]|uniref:luc7-like protein 3 n=1 Tax=Watersipora subatra TaxID=2589382 RepID=UPI00355B051F